MQIQIVVVGCLLEQVWVHRGSIGGLPDEPPPVSLEVGGGQTWLSVVVNRNMHCVLRTNGSEDLRQHLYIYIYFTPLIFI